MVPHAYYLIPLMLILLFISIGGIGAGDTLSNELNIIEIGN